MIHQENVTTPVLREFLNRLMVGATKPVFVIVDGRPIHKAKLVKKYIESLNGQLKLFFLLPSPPHLNPDETVGTHIKREIGGKTVNSLEEMKASYDACIAQTAETARSGKVILWSV